MLRLTFILCLALLVAACGGVSAKVNARNDMLKSKDAYKACLPANPDNPDKSEALKRAYEADLKAYEATSRGIRPARNNID
jgi:hypothetical protein